MRGILVVEDDEDLRDSLADLIRQLGGQPQPAASLAEVQAAEGDALGCAVALLDINLGDGVPSGLDVYTWLRERGFRGPVAFLTGHAHTHPGVAAAARLGDATVLRKPFGLDELRGVVGAGR